MKHRQDRMVSNVLECSIWECVCNQFQSEQRLNNIKITITISFALMDRNVHRLQIVSLGSSNWIGNG